MICLLLQHHRKLLLERAAREESDVPYLREKQPPAFEFRAVAVLWVAERVVPTSPFEARVAGGIARLHATKEVFGKSGLRAEARPVAPANGPTGGGRSSSSAAPRRRTERKSGCSFVRLPTTPCAPRASRCRASGTSPGFLAISWSAYGLAAACRRRRGASLLWTHEFGGIYTGLCFVALAGKSERGVVVE